MSTLVFQTHWVKKSVGKICGKNLGENLEKKNRQNAANNYPELHLIFRNFVNLRRLSNAEGTPSFPKVNNTSWGPQSIEHFNLEGLEGKGTEVSAGVAPWRDLHQLRVKAVSCP